MIFHHLFGVWSGPFRDDDFNGGETIPALQALPPSVGAVLYLSEAAGENMGGSSTFWAVHDDPYKTL